MAGKSVVLASNQVRSQDVADRHDEGAGHKGGLSRANPMCGHVGLGGNETAQDAVRTAGQDQEEVSKVKFYKRCGAITSKIAKAGFLPSGLHGVRCVGLPPTRVKAFRTTTGRCLPPYTAFAHMTTGHARMRPDPRVQDRAHRFVGRGGLGRTAGRRRAAQGVEAAATAGGMNPLWSRVSGPTGAIIMCLRQLGWTWPHHTTFITASGHEIDLSCAVGRVGARRRAEGAVTAPTAGVGSLGKQTRFPSPLGSSSYRSRQGCYPGRVVDAGSCEQGRSPRSPLLLDLRVASVRFSIASTVGLPSSPRSACLRLINIKARLRLVTN